MHLPSSTGRVSSEISPIPCATQAYPLHYNLEPAASSCVTQLHTITSDVAALHIRHITTTHPAAGHLWLVALSMPHPCPKLDNTRCHFLKSVAVHQIWVVDVRLHVPQICIIPHHRLY